MAEFFLMPQASPTMTVGVVARWRVPEGGKLAPQTVIAEVETDKATMEIEVFDEGVMLKHLAREGEEVPPGRPIAITGKAGDDITALLAEFAALSAAAPTAAAPTAAAPTAPAPAPATPAPASTPAAATPAPAAPPPEPPAEPGKVAAVEWAGKPVDSSIMEPRGRFVVPGPRRVVSPLARAKAADLGVDLRRVRGTGPGGRVVAADIDAAAAAPAATTPAAPADQARRVTQMRKTIARRLTEVHQQVPVFYLTVSYDVGAWVRLREVGKARGLSFSYNDLLVVAVARALRDVPAVNAAWTGDTILEKGAVDIGVAVALPEGLITPVVRNADTKKVTEIAAEVRALAARAKEGKLALEEYTGSTFTISNLGMFGIEHFTAILNPPEAAILAVGGVEQVPAVVNGQVAPAWRMKVTMTCDHRVIDGALGARFLAALRAYVEEPGLMVLA